MIIPGFMCGGGERMPLLYGADYENGPDHVKLKERLKKTLYYGKMPTMDRPSLAMTELAVELLQNLAPKEFGKVDMYWASDISREVCSSPCSLMLAMLYLKRLKKKDSPYLHQVSSSDLLLVALMVASKYLYDEGEVEQVLNEEWAQSANIDVDDINQLERTFLAAIDWNLYVSKAEFWSSLASLEQRIALGQGLQRAGSFTYTDLSVLMCGGRLSADVGRSLLQLCKVVFVCTLSYVACLHTLALSPAALSVASSLLPYASLASLPPHSLLTPGAVSLPHRFTSLPAVSLQSTLDTGRMSSFVLPHNAQYVHESSGNDFADESGDGPVNETLLSAGSFIDSAVSYDEEPEEVNETGVRCRQQQQRFESTDCAPQPVSRAQTERSGTESCETPRHCALNLPKFLITALTYDMLLTSVAKSLTSWFASPSHADNKKGSICQEGCSAEFNLDSSSESDCDHAAKACTRPSRIKKNSCPFVSKPYVGSGCKTGQQIDVCKSVPVPSEDLAQSAMCCCCCRSQSPPRCRHNSTCQWNTCTGSICQHAHIHSHFISAQTTPSFTEAPPALGSRTRKDLLEPCPELSCNEFIEHQRVEACSLSVGVGATTGRIVEVAG